MAKEIVVTVPPGSPLGKMSDTEIEKLVEQATAHLPKGQHAEFADHVVVKHAAEPAATGAAAKPNIGVGVTWTRACRN
ncbi:hypothetical protein [Granulicella arctica]|uniref:hypothetical protein n=1 Tax=Granulicella arctica TaxID=940613 RepID=UPI0021DF6179|nr:hypothetical protein [Granulicella arctica]